MRRTTTYPATTAARTLKPAKPSPISGPGLTPANAWPATNINAPAANITDFMLDFSVSFEHRSDSISTTPCHSSGREDMAVYTETSDIDTAWPGRGQVFAGLYAVGLLNGMFGKALVEGATTPLSAVLAQGGGVSWALWFCGFAAVHLTWS